MARVSNLDRACAFLADVAKMLREKNAAYGDSASNPVRIFSAAAPAEGLRVRIDDKLSRIARGSAAGEDVIFDLVGYLALLWVAEHGGRHGKRKQATATGGRHTARLAETPRRTGAVTTRLQARRARA